MGRPEATAKHFWAKVRREGACWEWQGARAHFGHGEARFQKKKIPAHRLAWRLVFGPVPEGLFVLHKCDNPPCVNPAHLFLGTQADNMNDKVAKDRQAKGSRHGMCRLTEDDVLDIRSAAAFGGTDSDIAAAYGLNRTTVSLIRRRMTWSDLP